MFRDVPCRSRLLATTLVVLLSGWIFCTGSLAQETWTLTTPDFKTQSIRVVKMDESGLSIVSPEGASETIKLDLNQVLCLKRSSARGMPHSPLLLALVDGSRIAGEPAGMSGESLRFNVTAMQKEMTIPLSQVVGLLKPGQSLPPGEEARTEDMLVLANGDVIRGVISGVSAQGVSVIAQEAAEPSVIPMNAISAALLATTAQEKPAAVRCFRVELSDGSVIFSPSVSIQGIFLQLSVMGQAGRVPFPAAAVIEQINGPVVWLSDLTPVENVQTPYTGERTRPARMNCTILGEPIRFGSQTFTRGIGVHSYSRLAYDLDRSFKSFRTQFAIDGELRWADVTVRIRLDDRIVLEKSGFKAGQLAAPFNVDLNGARTITLEVDYGENYDVQDRFNWIEPAFLR